MLDPPTYYTGIKADLAAQMDAGGRVAKVDIGYPRDYVEQQLSYSAMYGKP